jgi:hypothetical protein
VVNGLAAGIGCSLALACDLVVAAESAYFLLAFVNIGLTPDGGASATLAARVGHARAFEMRSSASGSLPPRRATAGNLRPRPVGMKVTLIVRRDITGVGAFA